MSASLPHEVEALLKRLRWWYTDACFKAPEQLRGNYVLRLLKDLTELAEKVVPAPSPGVRAEDGWQYTTEKVEPHSLCCDECKRALRERDEAIREANDVGEMLNRVAGERDEAREAMASALTSLGTGPLKDGYAYAVLEEALRAAGSEEESP